MAVSRSEWSGWASRVPRTPHRTHTRGFARVRGRIFCTLAHISGTPRRLLRTARILHCKILRRAPHAHWRAHCTGKHRTAWFMPLRCRYACVCPIPRPPRWDVNFLVAAGPQPHFCLLLQHRVRSRAICGVSTARPNIPRDADLFRCCIASATAQQHALTRGAPFYLLSRYRSALLAM